MNKKDLIPKSKIKITLLKKKNSRKIFYFFFMDFMKQSNKNFIQHFLFQYK
jgi:hypothetical protein